jgi:hypothetical protein
MNMPPPTLHSKKSVGELASAVRTAAQFLSWEAQSLADFHNYAQKFGGPPGGNVFEFVLVDALRNRGLTLEQFRAEAPTL